MGVPMSNQSLEFLEPYLDPISIKIVQAGLSSKNLYAQTYSNAIFQLKTKEEFLFQTLYIEFNLFPKEFQSIYGRKSPYCKICGNRDFMSSSPNGLLCKYCYKDYGPPKFMKVTKLLSLKLLELI